MSEFLDELARSVARPMPRSRAVRLLGGALLAGAVPAALRTPRAFGAPARGSGASTCPPTCSDPKFPVSCGCPGPVSGCFIGGCGEPGSKCCCFRDGAVVCPPGYRCGTGTAPPNCICIEVCGRGSDRVCCKPGKYCASPRHTLCCDKGTIPCISETSVGCCPPGRKCCGGECCYELTQTCGEGGGCTCKPGHTLRCGRDCCDPGHQKCCPTNDYGTKHCAPRGTVCCGFTWCRSDQKCCKGVCCRAGQACTSNGCQNPTASGTA